MPAKVICVFKMQTGNAAEAAMAALHGRTVMDELVVQFSILEAADNINSAISKLGWTLTKIRFETDKE
jgi:hypothetical protein